MPPSDSAKGGGGQDEPEAREGRVGAPWAFGAVDELPNVSNAKGAGGLTTPAPARVFSVGYRLLMQELSTLLGRDFE